MHLTSEQFQAAQTRGCQFQPASEAQIRQMAMQRRVFWLGTEAFLAQRSDGFYETAASLKKLLEQAAIPAAAPNPASPQAKAPEPRPATRPAPAAPPAQATTAEPAMPPATPPTAAPAVAKSAPVARRPAGRPRLQPAAVAATPPPPVPAPESMAEPEPATTPEPTTMPEPAIAEEPRPAPPPAIAAIASPHDADVMQCMAEIVDGYGRHQAMGPGELSALLTQVHHSLSGLLHPAPLAGPATAQVPASRRRRRSVTA